MVTLRQSFDELEKFGAVVAGATCLTDEFLRERDDSAGVRGSGCDGDAPAASELQESFVAE